MSATASLIGILLKSKSIEVRIFVSTFLVLILLLVTMIISSDIRIYNYCLFFLSLLKRLKKINVGISISKWLYFL